MKKCKYNLFFISMMILLSSCAKEKEVTKTYNLISEYHEYESVEHSEKENNFCLVNKSFYSDYIIPNAYVLDYESDLSKTETKINEDFYEVWEINKIDVNVLDIHTLELIKKIDLIPYIQPYLEMGWDAYGKGMTLGMSDGKIYLVENLKKRRTKKEVEDQIEEQYATLWFDVEHETVEFREGREGRISTASQEMSNIYMVSKTLLLDVSIDENINVFNSSYLKDTSVIEIPVAALPKENKKLYTLFPKLKDISRDEGFYAHIYLSPQTTSMEVISLLLEDGAELDFDLLKPDMNFEYGRYWKDGEMHYIRKKEYKEFQEEYYKYIGKEEADCLE